MLSKRVGTGENGHMLSQCSKKRSMLWKNHPPLRVWREAKTQSWLDRSEATSMLGSVSEVTLEPRGADEKICSMCEGDGDVVGVVTPLVRGGAQVLHGDQIVGLSVLLEVQEREEKGEDGEGQIEVEDERGELKERRTCTWMT